jgi:hypothetical protein
MSVKLRKPIENIPTNGTATDSPQTIPLPPLPIEAVVVSKEAIITCLKVFLPQLIDVDLLETGSFLLRVGPASTAE